MINLLFLLLFTVQANSYTTERIIIPSEFLDVKIEITEIEINGNYK